MKVISNISSALSMILPVILFIFFGLRPYLLDVNMGTVSVLCWIAIGLGVAGWILKIIWAHFQYPEPEETEMYPQAASLMTLILTGVYLFMSA